MNLLPASWKEIQRIESELSAFFVSSVCVNLADDAGTVDSGISRFAMNRLVFITTQVIESRRKPLKATVIYVHSLKCKTRV